MASSVIVGVTDNNCTREGHILYEQKYNTGHGLSAILMKYAEKYGVSRASRKYNKNRSYIYFWKERWDGSIASLACRSRRPHSQPNQHTEAGAEADPGYAPQRSQTRYGGTVAPLTPAGIYPPPGELLPRDAETGVIPTSTEEAGLQAQAL